jgi:hypothetical protein
VSIVLLTEARYSMPDRVLRSTCLRRHKTSHSLSHLNSCSLKRKSMPGPHTPSIIQLPTRQQFWAIVSEVSFLFGNEPVPRQSPYQRDTFLMVRTTDIVLKCSRQFHGIKQLSVGQCTARCCTSCSPGAAYCRAEGEPDPVSRSPGTIFRLPYNEITVALDRQDSRSCFRSTTVSRCDMLFQLQGLQENNT